MTIPQPEEFTSVLRTSPSQKLLDSPFAAFYDPGPYIYNDGDTLVEIKATLIIFLSIYVMLWYCTKLNAVKVSDLEEVSY